MQENQQNELWAALQRAAANMRAPTPNAQVANRFGESSPSGLPSWLTGANFALPHSGGFSQGYDEAQAARPQMPPQAPAPQQPAQAPMPQPQMGFFQRNAAMMRDPGTGDFIDPQAAGRAGDQGSLIKKMAAYLHRKADNS